MGLIIIIYREHNKAAKAQTRGETNLAALRFRNELFAAAERKLLFTREMRRE